MKSYPRIEREQLNPQSKRDRNKRCSVAGCHGVTTRRLIMEVSFMRGEDKVAGYTCNMHGKKYSGAPSIPNPDYLTDAMVLQAMHPHGGLGG